MAACGCVIWSGCLARWRWKAVLVLPPGYNKHINKRAHTTTWGWWGEVEPNFSARKWRHFTAWGTRAAAFWTSTTPRWRGFRTKAFNTNVLTGFVWKCGNLDVALKASFCIDWVKSRHTYDTLTCTNRTSLCLCQDVCVADVMLDSWFSKVPVLALLKSVCHYENKYHFTSFIAEFDLNLWTSFRALLRAKRLHRDLQTSGEKGRECREG